MDRDKLDELIADLDGAAGSFKPDLRSIDQAANLLQSDEESDRDEGGELILDAIDAVRSRAKEVRSIAESLRDV